VYWKDVLIINQHQRFLSHLSQSEKLLLLQKKKKRENILCYDLKVLDHEKYKTFGFNLWFLVESVMLLRSSDLLPHRD
jgi:hypothetical protein